MSSDEAVPVREPIKLGAFGQYVLGAHLRSESGGVVECFLAHQNLMDREVEVHVLRPSKEANPSVFQRFLDVMGKLAKIDHPGLVHILDVDVVGARAFFTTPCRSAVRLSEHLRARGAPLDWSEVRGHARTLAGALVQVHASGLLVRGISLDAVFLDRERQQVYLGECPLGKDEQIVTAADGPAFHPIAGQLWDERTDLFLLASLLYELGTGRLPYAGGRAATRPAAPAGRSASVEGLADMVAKGMTMDATLGLRGEADALLAGVLETALAIRAGERPSSAAELLAALEGPKQEDPLAARDGRGEPGPQVASGAPTPGKRPALRPSPAPPRGVMLMLALGLGLGLIGLFGRPSGTLTPGVDRERVREVPAVPGPISQGPAGRDIEKLALQAKVRPTRGDAFEARWKELQEWTREGAGRGDGLCTATDLIMVRMAHLRGDEASAGRLDDCLRRAAAAARP